MKYIVAILLCCIIGCGSDDFARKIRNKQRFLTDNNSTVKITKIDSLGFHRKVNVYGILTREETWAYFDAILTPKVGEVWRISTVVENDAIYYRLSFLSPELED